MSFVNSPIHDLLIRIKNSYMAKRQKIEWVLYSKFKVQVLVLLKKYWFIKDYKIQEDVDKKFLIIYLNPINDLINDIPVVKFYSKPSRKRYVSWKDIKYVAGGRWIWIISTNEWLMASHEAKAKKIWWELIAEIY